MVKKKTSRSNSKSAHKTKRHKKAAIFSVISSKRWIVIAIALAIGVGSYNFLVNHEDFGPQLPPPPADALYKQADQPVEARVKDLLSYMTLEEKIGQMALVDKNSLVKIEDIKKYNLGGVLSGAGAKPSVNTPQGWLDMISVMKQQAANSRLGIPILYGVDANHGHANMLGATVFPHAIGLGASQDSELVQRVALATAKELKATGINWSYSPSLDAPKDIRWGRVYEAFSDDPELNGKLGAAYIAGTQTSRADQADKSYVMATAKHYLGTGAMLWGKSNHR
ncbi:hypothetical protein H0X10_04590, partial [Candidatus Saccharibacteria bacterium]|nr:hypothetical protein [Candidatus Saccharibacteria bacterium]